MAQEYHDLSFKCIYQSKKRLYLGLLKAKTLVGNEQYEFKFEVTNVGKKPFPGGIIEFNVFPIEPHRLSPTQPPQTMTIGLNSGHIPTFKITSLKPGETKKSSTDILEFYTIGTIKLSGTLKSDDNISVMHRRAGTRKPNGSWTTGVSSAFEVILRVDDHKTISKNIITLIFLIIAITGLIIASRSLIMAWCKYVLGWILNILSKR